MMTSATPDARRADRHHAPLLIAVRKNACSITVPHRPPRDPNTQERERRPVEDRDRHR